MKNSLTLISITLLFPIFLLTCNDQDSLITTPEAESNLSKRVKMAYYVHLTAGEVEGNNIVTTVKPGKTPESTLYAMWHGEAADGISIQIYHDGVTYLLNQGAELGVRFAKGKNKEIIAFSLLIYDLAGNGYRTGRIDLHPDNYILENPIGFTIEADIPNVPIYKMTKNWDKLKTENIIGEISFGHIVYVPI